MHVCMIVLILKEITEISYLFFAIRKEIDDESLAAIIILEGLTSWHDSLTMAVDNINTQVTSELVKKPF